MLSMTARAHFTAKEGNERAVWEDGCAYSEQHRRLFVGDGASSGWRSYDWMDVLVDEWCRLQPVVTDAKAVRGWFATAQERWPLLVRQRIDELVAAGTPEHLVRGSKTLAAATILAVELRDTAEGPMWVAGALGDTNLFHVRDGVLVDAFPLKQPADFGKTPDAIQSETAQLEHAIAAWQIGHGGLRHGDVLLGVTDALAKWAMDTAPTDPTVWDTLGAVDDAAFHRLVADLRDARQIENDDVTLAIVHVEVPS